MHRTLPFLDRFNPCFDILINWIAVCRAKFHVREKTITEQVKNSIRR